MTAIDAAGAPLRSAPPPARQPAADPPYTHTSPTVPATSPSTVKASPLSTPHSVSFPNGSTNRVKSSDAPKQRARLACARCRTSKIKCWTEENHDFTKVPIDPCLNCIKSGRPCQWPTAATAATAAKKTSATAGPDASLADRLSEPRKRKKVMPSEVKVETEEDFFKPHLYSPKVWRELYGIFKQHYATELPFFRDTTFLPWLEQKDLQTLSDSDAPLVLAFLSLTVPFRDELIRQLSRDGRFSAIQISRVYAEAADARIQETRALYKPSIELVQALLMLSLHAYGDCQGTKSSVMLGNAIACMQELKLHYESGLNVIKEQPSGLLPIDKDRFIHEERKRRTFWSCYIIDRYVGMGDYKPCKIHLTDTLVQLPCSDNAFEYGTKTIMTRMLRETDGDFKARQEAYYQCHPKGAHVKWEDEDAQEPLVWFIKALDLCQDVMKWACRTTRRNEKDPPWLKTFIEKFDQFGGSIKKEQKLSFANLDERLRRMIDRLPDELKLDTSMTLARISRGTSTPYILLHSVFAQCNIALHREWLPFLTHPREGPSGPRGGPAAEALKDRALNEAPTFWKESAARCFKATREYLDLLWTCAQRGKLVETPFTSFVLYTVVCTIMWCGFWPNMDEKHYVCSRKDSPDAYDNFDRAARLLDSLQSRLNMARMWCKRSEEYSQELIDARRLWRSVFGSPGADTTPKDPKNPEYSLNLYKKLERRLKNPGPEHDEDYQNLKSYPVMNLEDVIQRSRQKINDPYSPHVAKNELKNEDETTTLGTSNAGSLPPPHGNDFTPINQQSPKPSITSSSHVSPPQSSPPQHQPSHGTPTHGLPSSYHENFAVTTAPSRQQFVTATTNSYNAMDKESAPTRHINDHGRPMDFVPQTSNYNYPTPEVINHFFDSCYPPEYLGWGSHMEFQTQNLVNGPVNLPFQDVYEAPSMTHQYNHGSTGL